MNIINLLKEQEIKENVRYKTFDKEQVVFDEGAKCYGIGIVIEGEILIKTFTYNVKEDDYQTKLYNQLQKEKVIVVSMRSPYDYLYLNNYGAHICIYEATSLAYESLSLCLLGVEKFKGKLPIKK